MTSYIAAVRYDVTRSTGAGAGLCQAGRSVGGAIDCWAERGRSSSPVVLVDGYMAAWLSECRLFAAVATGLLVGGVVVVQVVLWQSAVSWCVGVVSLAWPPSSERPQSNS